MQKTLGGDRLGSGNKNKVYMHNYERSTHDLSYIWKSTMAAGTLVPFMSEVALPGDTFDIVHDVDGLTHPTIGPLFGSYKIQLDVFQVPIRLYQGKLHMNMLGIGMDMSKVALPTMLVRGAGLEKTKVLDNQQINSSAILSYLGIRGVGYDNTNIDVVTQRYFNAVPYLGYWDIYKNYYANKQEEIGAMIHKDINQAAPVITKYNLVGAYPDIEVLAADTDYTESTCATGTRLIITCSTGVTNSLSPANFIIKLTWPNAEEREYPADQLFLSWTNNPTDQALIGENPAPYMKQLLGWGPIAVTPQPIS